MTTKEEFALARQVFEAQNNTLQMLSDWCQMLSDVLADVLNRESNLIARIALLEQSVVYKEDMPDE